MRQAAAEGLALEPSDNATGLKGVSFNRSSLHTPYQAHVQRDGKSLHLGCFVTAGEAALCRARDNARQAPSNPADHSRHQQPPPAKRVKVEAAPPMWRDAWMRRALAWRDISAMTTRY